LTNHCWPSPIGKDVGSKVVDGETRRELFEPFFDAKDKFGLKNSMVKSEGTRGRRDLVKRG